MDLQLPNPFDKNRPYVRPQGISSKEWTRIGAMSVLFVICLGTMIVLHFVRKSPKKETKKPVAQVPTETEPERKEGPPPSQNPEEKAAETLRTLRDGPEPIRKDQPEFLDFLYLMLSKTSEDVAARVESGVGPDQILADPAQARGKYVRIRGRLIQLYTEPLPVTTTTGTRDVYFGVLQAHPSNRTVAFYLAQLPDIRFRTKNYQGESLIEDWIEIEGMFLRVYEYEGQPDASGRSSMIRAPLLFARTVRASPPPKMANPRNEFYWLIGGTAGVVILIVMIAGIVTRKRDRRSLRMEMVNVKLGKAKAEGKSLFPAANPVLGPEVKPPEPPKPES